MTPRPLSPSSYWLRNVELRPRHGRLETEHETEVLVIGAGITGLSTALALLERGRKVTVCESSVIGAGTTGGSTGHLDADPEQGSRALIETIGLDDARRATALRLAAIDTIEQRACDSCDFVRVRAVHFSENPNDRRELEDECDAAAELGMTTRRLDDVPLPRAACGYAIESMARFNCMSYLRRLERLVLDKGGRIFEGTQVEPPNESAPQSLRAGGGRIRFDHVVSAVHSGFTGSNLIYMQIPPYQSYAIAVRLENPPDDSLYWDNSEPYFYIRRASSDDDSVYIIGGCDHHTGGDAAAAEARLEQYVRDRYDIREVICRWSAELFEPIGGLPLIGRSTGAENVWTITGLSGIGLTWGTAAAELIADQIDGKETVLQDRLSPSRFGLGEMTKMVTEHLPAAASFAERVLPAESIDPEKLAPGEGRVGKLGGSHAAVCRTGDGTLHACSPICTHMGGVLRWNAAEQTWDCPVHGGRFAADGQRMYGPPDVNLDPIQASSVVEE